MKIDKFGWMIDPRVVVKQFPHLKHGEMTEINGIIVHQTGAPTLSSTFNSYNTGSPNGAHFLIDRDGTIYQTGSLIWKLWHVGQLKPRCLATLSCSVAESKDIKAWRTMEVFRQEKLKSFPDRFPSNDDAVGIELVGDTLTKSNDSEFEHVTDEQNNSLSWLVSNLTKQYSIPVMEIYRHPQVSYKNQHEAETAKW